MVLTGDRYLVRTPYPWDTDQSACKYQASENGAPDGASPMEIPVWGAHRMLWHDTNNATEMRKIILSLISFSIFVTSMFHHIPTTTMYRQHYGVFSALVTSGGDAITDESPAKFYNIETIPDIFDWLNDTFIPQVFVTTDYNGAALPQNQWGRIATFNKVLGAVHFEVTYMEPGECETPEFLVDIYSTCYDSSSTTTDELLIRFDTNVSDATTLLTEKKDNGKWLNSSTRQLAITVITLNAQLPGYAVTKLQLDFNDGGYVEPSASTTSILLNQYPSASTIVLDVLVVMWFLPSILAPSIWLRRIISYGRTLFRMYHKKHRLRTLRRWQKFAKSKAEWIDDAGGWLLITVFKGPILCLFYITVIITQVLTMNSDFRRKLVSIGEGGQTDADASDTLISVTHSFQLIAILTVLLRLFAAAAVLVLGLRILYTFRGFFALGILTRTMENTLGYIWAFSGVFAAVFVAFAVAGTVLFGDRVQDFSSVLGAMNACINMTYGNFDFDSIKDIDYSVVYYLAYMAMETFVLLNIALAVVIDAYEEEKKAAVGIKYWKPYRVVKSLFRQCLERMNDRLWISCCHYENGRHDVVFWGRIRPVVLLDKLEKQLITWFDATRGRDPTLLTAMTLKEWFPEATLKECEATITPLLKLLSEKNAMTGELPSDPDPFDVYVSTLINAQPSLV